MDSGVTEHRFYHRGNYLHGTLTLAIADREGYSRGEIVSQNCVQVWCTDEQWVDLLKEIQAGSK